MSLINQFLETGRELLAVEKQFYDMSPRHPDRDRLNNEHTELQRRQTSQILTALQAGIDQKTIEFALAQHGQGAHREVYHGQRSPAEDLQVVLHSREHKPGSVEKTVTTVNWGT